MDTKAALILFLAANPIDTAPLQLDEEVRAIDAAIQTARLRDGVRLAAHWAVRVEDVVELLLRHQPVILHFSGHGSPNDKLVLTTAEGSHLEVDEHAFTDLVRLAGRTVRCAFLNACYSEVQAKLLAEHIPAAIGASAAIEDSAALLFARTFYLAFCSGESIATAFGLAQAELQATRPDQVQYIHLLGDDSSTSFCLTAAEQRGGAAPSIHNSTVKGVVQVNYGQVSMTFNEAPE